MKKKERYTKMNMKMNRGTKIVRKRDTKSKIMWIKEGKRIRQIEGWSFRRMCVLYAGTERAEHIQIIITSAQKADNVIPTLDQFLSTIRVGLINISGNIGISPSLYIFRGVRD